MSLRTVDLEDVLHGAADLSGLDRDLLSTRDFRTLRQFASKRLMTAWEFNSWPELMRCEKRYFRPLYVAGTAYAAPTLTAVSEVFFPQTQKYYQALSALPLSVTSITRVTTTATVTLAAPSRLSTGDQVTISGATQSDYNITATITVTDTTHFTYTVANSPTTPATGTIKCSPDPANSGGTTATAYWQDSLPYYSPSATWVAGETNGKGDIRYWPLTDRFYAYFSLTSSAGNQPTDTTRWAVLTDFNRVIDYEQTGETAIGEVLWVGSGSPKLTTRSREYGTYLSEDGIQVLGNPPFAWIEYKIRTPTLFGERFDVAATYAVDAQVYYSSDAVPGNMYNVLSTTTAGDTPESAASKFSVVEIPLIFQRYLEWGMYADYLRSDGQEEKANIQAAFADEHLATQKQLLDGPQNQVKRTVVLTR